MNCKKSDSHDHILMYLSETCIKTNAGVFTVTYLLNPVLHFTGSTHVQWLQLMIQLSCMDLWGMQLLGLKITD